MWDVDGAGIQRIVDPQLAARIKQRVDSLNVDTLRTALGVSAAFVVLPALLGADE